MFKNTKNNKEMSFNQWVSILIASHNTSPEYIKECLDSIQKQEGLGKTFNIELVWINDGSDSKHSELLEKMLKNFEKNIEKHVKIKYLTIPINKGLSYCLHHGVLLCSYDLIFRMDSDDIMHESRMQRQLEFMNQNPKCVLCGTNIVSFIKDEKNNDRMLEVERSNHPESLTWEEYKKTKKSWILNHPTLCFRKYAVISVNNYNQYLTEPFEDLDLELRILKKYGFVCNLKETLLYYRIHENQITWMNRKNSQINNQKKKAMIEELINA